MRLTDSSSSLMHTPQQKPHNSIPEAHRMEPDLDQVAAAEVEAALAAVGQVVVEVGRNWEGWMISGGRNAKAANECIGWCWEGI